MIYFIPHLTAVISSSISSSCIVKRAQMATWGCPTTPTRCLPLCAILRRFRSLLRSFFPARHLWDYVPPFPIIEDSWSIVNTLGIFGWASWNKVFSTEMMMVLKLPLGTQYCFIPELSSSLFLGEARKPDVRARREVICATCSWRALYALLEIPI